MNGSCYIGVRLVVVAVDQSNAPKRHQDDNYISHQRLDLGNHSVQDFLVYSNKESLMRSIMATECFILLIAQAVVDQFHAVREDFIHS